MVASHTVAPIGAAKGTRAAHVAYPRAGYIIGGNPIPAISKNLKAFLYGWLPLSDAAGIIIANCLTASFPCKPPLSDASGILFANGLTVSFPCKPPSAYRHLLCWGEEKNYPYSSLLGRNKKLSLSLLCIRAVVAEELVDEVEIFFGDEHHVTAEAFPHFDEVSPAAGYESPHAAEACGHRRAVGNQYSHSYHPHIAACSSRQCRQLADGTCLALRAGQLLVHHLVLVHDEEYFQP